jgi:hypothetical protein
MAALVSPSIYMLFLAPLHYYSLFLSNLFFGTHIPSKDIPRLPALEACRSKVAPHDITVSLHSAQPHTQLLGSIHC